MRRKPFDLLSAVIFLSAEDSTFIAPVKPGMFRSPDSFAAVSEKKWSFKELRRVMIAFYCYEMMLRMEWL